MALKNLSVWSLSLALALSGLACGTPSKERSRSPATGGSTSTNPPDQENDCTATLNMVDTAAPTYLGSGQIKDLFITRCTWCHSAQAPSSDRTAPYLTDIDLIRSQSNKIIQEIETGKMPPPQEQMSLSSSEIQQVRTWIQDGLLEGTSPSWNTTTALAYKELEPLITKRCLPCHDTSINQAPSLNTEANAIAQHAAIATAVNGGTMPPGVPFDTQEKAVISNWSAALLADPANGGDTQCP